MKKVIPLLLFFWGTGCIVKAQNNCVPGKVFDYQNQIDGFKSIVLLNTGDYIAGGSTWIPDIGNYNMCFARLDACGDTVWTKLYGQIHESFVDADMYYKPGDDFVVSTSLYYNHILQVYGYALVRIYIENGDTVWLKTYLNSFKNTASKDVIQTADGGFALVGFSQNFTNDYAKIGLVKTDSEGNVEWEMFYGTDSNSEVGEHLLQLPDGGYLILGRRTTVSSGLVRIWLIRTDAQGNILWERLYGNNFATYGSDLIPVSDGYMIGGIQYAAPTWQIAGDAYLLKTDTFGITQWVRIYGGQHGEQLDKIMPLEDGNYACIGSNATMGTGGGSADGWLFKVNAAGDSLWSRTYRYETSVVRSEYFWDFAPAPEGGFMMCGFVGRPFPHNQDAWVVRTDSLGNPCPPYNGCDWAVGVPPPSPSPTNEEISVQVYPNPAQNTLHFTLQNPLTPPSGGWGAWSVSLFTPAGQRVLHSVAAASSVTHTVQVGHLPVGVYFYVVESGGMVVARGKVAKM